MVTRMTEIPMAGGKRRIDQVLGPGYADELGNLETDEVRHRRDLTRLERESLSFVRRLLQGRRDILRDELERRRTGGQPVPIVERLVSVLSEGSRGPSRGEAPVIPLPEEEVMKARRRVERLVSDSHLSNLDALSDADIEEVVGRIEDEERSVSDARAKVIDVHDSLQDEMKRRLRAELGKLAP